MFSKTKQTEELINLRQIVESGNANQTELTKVLTTLNGKIADLEKISDAIIEETAVNSQKIGLLENHSTRFREDFIKKEVMYCFENKLKSALQLSKKLGNKKTRLKALFLVQLAETWPSIASIWEAFNSDHLWESKLVVLPFYHPYIKGENISTLLSDMSIPFEKSDLFSIDQYHPDIVFFQEPYDSTQPEAYHVRKLVNEGYRVGYAPYGIELSGTDTGLRYQFDMDMQNLTWRVFSRSERHKRMYGKYCTNGNNHVVVTGHPKFDLLNKYVPDHDYYLIKNKAKERKIVLWNPHFCMDPNEQYSTFFDFRDIIMEYFKTHDDLFLLVRPHPLFYMYVLENGYMTQTELDYFISEISKSENMFLDRTPTYQWAFHVSDAMISDMGSFILEYLATLKPLLFTKAKNSPKMNDDGTIEDYHYKGHNEAQVVSFLDMVKKGEDIMKDKRISIIDEYLFGLNTNIGEKIKNYVTQNILSESYATLAELDDQLQALVSEFELVHHI